jgi:hypothetical protein
MSTSGSTRGLAGWFRIVVNTAVSAAAHVNRNNMIAPGIISISTISTSFPV